MNDATSRLLDDAAAGGVPRKAHELKAAHAAAANFLSEQGIVRSFFPRGARAG
jgi:hypothetical protein